jgi:2-polyprenyl-3-methyl-5-hydroxy-6-metoxy-1,4-benzoquinol methylase
MTEKDSNAAVSPTEVTEANQRYHDKIVESYESITHAGCAHYDVRVAQSLAKMVSALGGGNGRSALDVGAGIGFFTKHLLNAGFAVDAVEVSGGMADELERRLGSTGRLKVIREDAVSYLSKTEKQYSVVSFISVLHHLYDYCEVLEHAAAHVEPGGFLYTSCDPVSSDNPTAGRWIHLLDRGAFVLFHPGMILRKLGRLAKPAEQASPDIDLAEFHAARGIRIPDVTRAIEKQGLQPVAVVKNAACRMSGFRRMEKALGAGSDLEMLWRRPAE